MSKLRNNATDEYQAFASVYGTTIYLKEKHLLGELFKLQQKNNLLFNMAMELCQISYEDFGKNAVITSIYRGPDHPLYRKGSVHAYWRGIDFRVHHYTPLEEKKLELHFERNYIYDENRDDKKCFLIHGEGWNRHIHMQTHPETVCLS